MKNTLLALMLVSSLFVISCGADATKPGDAYKNQPTETTTGIKTYYFASVTTDATGANVVDLTSFMTVGVKVTDIVQIMTTTTGTTTTTTTNTNAVTGTTKNADGGIYKFTTDAAATTSGNAIVTYKYIQRETAPTVEKETTGTYAGSTTSPLTMDASFTDKSKAFEKNVVSVTDKYGAQLINGTEYTYDSATDEVTIKKIGYTTGDKFTVRYSYRDISMISEKPLTGNVTVTDATGTGGTVTVTIPLDAALYAGRSCYLKAVITDTPASSGRPKTETIYYNGIITSTGIIDITRLITTITSPSATTTTGTYEIWVY